MWKLEVSHNDVSSVPAMAFYGLERALWELHLPHNKLTRIPSESLTLLKKLSVLNLAGKSNPFDSHSCQRFVISTVIIDVILSHL
jgi:Leucine-rich repeat (LRR) protein